MKSKYIKVHRGTLEKEEGYRTHFSTSPLRAKSYLVSHKYRQTKRGNREGN